MRTMHSRIVLVLVMALLISSHVAAKPVTAQGTALYELIDLGALIGEDLALPEGRCAGYEGAVTALNDNRLAAGYYPHSETKVSPALYLGDTFLRLEGGKGGGQALAINNSGVIVGLTYETPRVAPCDLPTGRLAAIWYGQELVPLAMPSGGTESQANDVNDAGVAAGWYLRRGAVQPITWENDAAAPLPLPLLREVSADDGQAFAINDSGSAVGYARWREDGEVVRQTAVYWQDGKAVRLETLGNKIGNVATDLNERGDIAGYARTEQGDTVAVRWNGDQIEQLPEVRLATESRALAVNEAGDMAGYAVTSNGQVAILWTAGEALLLNALVLPGSGLTLLEATAINEKGEIAGVAIDAGGVRHGFILTPVEAAG